MQCKMHAHGMNAPGMGALAGAAQGKGFRGGVTGTLVDCWAHGALTWVNLGTTCEVGRYM
jgi:hypothetical protein